MTQTLKQNFKPDYVHARLARLEATARETNDMVRLILQHLQPASAQPMSAEPVSAAKTAGSAPLPSQSSQATVDAIANAVTAPPPRHSKLGDVSVFGKSIQQTCTNGLGGIGPQSVFAKKHQKSEDGSNPPSRSASTSNLFHLLNQGQSAHWQRQGSRCRRGRHGRS